MSEPMLIDFFVAVPDERAASSVASVAARQGYDAKTDFDDESNTWTVVCSRKMVPTYDAIVNAQAELDALGKPFAGKSDGWGTLGNVKPS